jgi:hypothetical protein
MEWDRTDVLDKAVIWIGIGQIYWIRQPYGIGRMYWIRQPY